MQATTRPVTFLEEDLLQHASKDPPLLLGLPRSAVQQYEHRALQPEDIERVHLHGRRCSHVAVMRAQE